MNNCRNHIFPNYLAKVEIQPINTNEYTCIHMFYFLLNLIHIKKDMKDYTSACLHVDDYISRSTLAESMKRVPLCFATKGYSHC